MSKYRTIDGQPIDYDGGDGSPTGSNGGSDIRPAFPQYNMASHREALGLLDIEIRYDVRGHRPQYNRGDGWRDLDGYRIKHIRDRLASKLHKATTRKPAPFGGSATLSGVAWRARPPHDEGRKHFK